MKPRLGIIVIGILSALVTSCADVAVTGAQVAYNHKNIQENLNDKYITMRASQMINNMDKPTFKGTNISVATLGGDVLMTGESPKVWQKEEAARLVHTLPGVNKVYNLVRVAPPTSALTRISDAWITTKVKGRIIASNDIDATKVKVVTEDGRVHLMGTVYPTEANAAVEIARTTEGVKSVVKVFKYIKVIKPA